MFNQTGALKTSGRIPLRFMSSLLGRRHSIPSRRHSLPFPLPPVSAPSRPAPSRSRSLPFPLPPVPAPSRPCSLPSPLPPVPAPSRPRSLPFPLPPVPAPSRSRSLPFPLPPVSAPSRPCSLPSLLPPVPAPSRSRSLPFLLPPVPHTRWWTVSESTGRIPSFSSPESYRLAVKTASRNLKKTVEVWGREWDAINSGNDLFAARNLNRIEGVAISFRDTGVQL